MPVSRADGEQRLEIVLREDLERDHGVRPPDALELREAPRDQRRELILPTDADMTSGSPRTARFSCCNAGGGR